MCVSHSLAACLTSSFIDDIIKLKNKKQAPRGKGAATGAGGGRKTKQQIVQKQVIRQQQQQKRSKLSIPKVNCLIFHVTNELSEISILDIGTVIFRAGKQGRVNVGGSRVLLQQLGRDLAAHLLQDSLQSAQGGAVGVAEEVE